jgi:hypothetical protein
MPRALQPQVALLIRPIPSDFSVDFEDNGHFVRWKATLTVEGHGPIDVELGYSRAGGTADEAKERTNLRESAWQAMELARLGRLDMLQFCHVNRHQRDRPVSRPQITVGG